MAIVLDEEAENELSLQRKNDQCLNETVLKKRINLRKQEREKVVL